MEKLWLGEPDDAITSVSLGLSWEAVPDGRAGEGVLTGELLIFTEWQLVPQEEEVGEVRTRLTEAAMTVLGQKELRWELRTERVYTRWIGLDTRVMRPGMGVQWRASSLSHSAVCDSLDWFARLGR